jgi:hypothetical protein
MIEEQYVVDLINKSFDSVKKTNLDEWQFNLKFLKTNYNRIKALLNIMHSEAEQ